MKEIEWTSSSLNCDNSHINLVSLNISVKPGRRKTNRNLYFIVYPWIMKHSSTKLTYISAALSLCSLYTMKVKYTVTVWRMYAGPQAVWSQMSVSVWSTELEAVGGPTTPVPGAFHFLHIAAIWPSQPIKLVSSLTTATEFSGMAKNNVLKIIMMHTNWIAFRFSVLSWRRKGTPNQTES